MKRWLLKHAEAHFAAQQDDELSERDSEVYRGASEHLWFLDRDELRPLDRDLVVKLRSRWPIFKPPAMITIDDRALNFTGEWPTIDALDSFKPWYHK